MVVKHWEANKIVKVYGSVDRVSNYRSFEACKLFLCTIRNKLYVLLAYNFQAKKETNVRLAHFIFGHKAAAIFGLSWKIVL